MLTRKVALMLLCHLFVAGCGPSTDPASSSGWSTNGLGSYTTGPYANVPPYDYSIFDGRSSGIYSSKFNDMRAPAIGGITPIGSPGAIERITVRFRAFVFLIKGQSENPVGEHREFLH
jgi:hypothetical protein